jgi:3-phosphoshikimate 1-carboxyvinyltransferase
MKYITLTPLTKMITKTLTIPGSKSYTNRALFIAALTKNPVTISNPLRSTDTKAMSDCLQQLGITINHADNHIAVLGSIEDIKNKRYQLNANLSGITIRFLLALSTIIPGTKTLTGAEGLKKRPINDLVESLRAVGADITYLETTGFPPLQIKKGTPSHHTVTLNGSVSSQYLSALLLIAPFLEGLTITLSGKQISKPYIAMTIECMKQFGIQVIQKENTYHIPSGQTYQGTHYCIEGDFSSAGYFFAIAALTKSTITLRNLNPKSLQADRKLLTILEKMGNTILTNKNEITIIGNGVKPLLIDALDFPDQVQTLAVLASFANGITTIQGVQSLRVKETERVIALQQELKKMGIKTEATEDTLTIYGGNPKPATIDTYGDHRMGMSFAIAGTKLKGMRINDPDVVNKTFPDFWKKLQTL